MTHFYLATVYSRTVGRSIWGQTCCREELLMHTLRNNSYPDEPFTESDSVQECPTKPPPRMRRSTRCPPCAETRARESARSRNHTSTHTNSNKTDNMVYRGVDTSAPVRIQTLFRNHLKVNLAGKINMCLTYLCCIKTQAHS